MYKASFKPEAPPYAACSTFVSSYPFTLEYIHACTLATRQRGAHSSRILSFDDLIYKNIFQLVCKYIGSIYTGWGPLLCTLHIYVMPVFMLLHQIRTGWCGVGEKVPRIPLSTVRSVIGELEGIYSSLAEGHWCNVEEE